MKLQKLQKPRVVLDVFFTKEPKTCQSHARHHIDGWMGRLKTRQAR